MHRTMCGVYSDSLMEWALRIDRVSRIQAAIYGTTAIVCFSYPVILYLSSGERGYIVLCFLPFLDINSLLGYYVNTVYQFVLGMITVCSLYGVDLMMINLLFTGAAYIDSVKHECDRLSAELVKTKRNAKKISALLLTVVVRGQETDR